MSKCLFLVKNIPRYNSKGDVCSIAVSVYCYVVKNINISIFKDGGIIDTIWLIQNKKSLVSVEWCAVVYLGKVRRIGK